MGMTSHINGMDTTGMIWNDHCDDVEYQWDDWWDDTGIYCASSSKSYHILIAIILNPKSSKDVCIFPMIIYWDDGRHR